MKNPMTTQIDTSCTTDMRRMFGENSREADSLITEESLNRATWAYEHGYKVAFGLLFASYIVAIVLVGTFTHN